MKLCDMAKCSQTNVHLRFTLKCGFLIKCAVCPEPLELFLALRYFALLISCKLCNYNDKNISSLVRNLHPEKCGAILLKNTINKTNF